MRKIRKSRPKLLIPSYKERRGDNCLLLWGDIPHWTVVDSEMLSILEKLDGKSTLEQILKTVPQWHQERNQIASLIGSFFDAGILEAEGIEVRGKKEKIQTGIPIENIAYNLTRQCNLRCRFCYNSEYLVRDDSDELTEEEVTAFLKRISGLASSNCTFTILGGEPLIYPEKLLNISKYAMKLGIDPLISTNGTFVTKEFAKEAAKTGLEIQVSIEGHNEELNDLIRGKGSFKRITDGIKTLVDNGVHTILSMVCHNGNMDFLGEFFCYAKSLEASEARYVPLKLMGGAVDSEIKPVDMNKLVKKSANLFKRNPDFVQMAGRDAFNIIANACRISAKRRSCGTGLQTFLLDSDGSIYPCLNTDMPEFKMGNIRDDDFDFVRFWSESERLAEHRKLTSVEEEINECSKCYVRYWCLGVCRGETYINMGALNKRAYNCKSSRASIIETIWLIAENKEIFRGSKLIR